jgi:hypothetical protein
LPNALGKDAQKALARCAELLEAEVGGEDDGLSIRRVRGVITVELAGCQRPFRGTLAKLALEYVIVATFARNEDKRLAIGSKRW